MSELQRLYLSIGDELFERGELEYALSYYLKSYDEGDSPKALARIQERYLLPQETNFEKYYAENCRITNSSFDYGKCQIDAIPVADRRYVLFDREQETFCGCFNLDSYMDKGEKPSRTFQSVLIADCWDAREILPVLHRHIWNNAYILLNESSQKFMSFLKIPEFVSLLPKNIHIFMNYDEMCNYFAENPDEYLPHVIYASDQEKYRNIVEDIHQKRIRSNVHSNQVFLSICIPSYNRGKLALEAVCCALQTKYDAEVEVVVSNNGSCIGKEEYEAIRTMNDSRVQYYQLEKNEGPAANICNCLEKSAGHFAILFSDEENLIVEKLDQLLEYLWDNQDLGSFKVPDKDTGTGAITNLNKFKQGRYSKGMEALERAWKTKYLSGLGFNMTAVRQYGLLQKVNISSINSIDIDVVYPHTAILVYLAQYLDFADIAINMWFHAEECAVGGSIEDENSCVKGYMIPENRFQQEKSALKMIEDVLTFEDYTGAILQQVHMTFSYISEAVLVCAEETDFLYNWEDIHTMHYKKCLEIIRESKWGIESFNESFFRDLDEVFFDWLDCRRIRPAFSNKENLKSTLRAQMARYCYDCGTPFLKIDFKAINEQLDGVIRPFLPGNMQN